MNETEAWELFWESSSLDATRLPAFARRLETYVPRVALRLATYPGDDIVLLRPHDRLARSLARRSSGRSFGRGRISVRQLGSLFEAFAGNKRGSRVFPSAGSLYPLEIFCLVNAAEGGLDGTAVCYNADNHSLSRVRAIPLWEEYRDVLSFPLEGMPQLVFIFVLFDGEMSEKYGARGGRFGLIEVGHAAQNLALRVAYEGLVGCEVGGTLDRPVLELLGLAGTGGRVALAYVCGIPPASG